MESMFAIHVPRGSFRRRLPGALPLFVFLLGLAAGTIGCSRGDRPELGLVRGKVTFDGAPLAEAFVVFTPLAGGRQSSGFTNQDGIYELNYLRDIKGAKIGAHRVAVATATEMSAERLPARYHSETTLEAELNFRRFQAAQAARFRYFSRSSSN